MTTNKFLKQVADIFDMERRKCEKEKKCLNQALKKLKKREGELEGRLKKEKSDKSRSKIKNDIKVIEAQIKKGRKLLSDLD